MVGFCHGGDLLGNHDDDGDGDDDDDVEGLLGSVGHTALFAAGTVLLPAISLGNVKFVRIRRKIQF